MIKKIIYTIGLMMFLSGPLYPLFSQAAVTNDEGKAAGGCEKFFDTKSPGSLLGFMPLRCRFGREENTGLDWGDSFGSKDPDKVGKNLYQIIYDKTAIKPTDAAMQATADQYGIRLEQMTMIVGGDLTYILQKNPIMRMDDAKRIYNNMMETYRAKKNSIDLEANIKAKVEPNEMFADGDLSNSGFDLINDLNNIEIILFKKAEATSIGGNHPNGADKDAGGAGGNPAVPGPDDQNLNLTPTPITNAGGADGLSKTNDLAKAIPKNPFETNGNGSKAGILNGMNPNQCFAENETKKALDDFQKNLQNDTKLQSTFVPKVTPNDGTGNSGSAPTDGAIPPISGGTSDNNLLTNDSANQTPVVPPLAPAVADNWDKDPFCDGILCISLDFIKKPATPAFNKTDNCIQCHVQYINDSLQKTLSHSLIPGKAAGNLGESGLCKNAAGTSLGSVGMNVSLSIVPIITPAKNEMADLSLDMGISKSGKEFATKTANEWELFACKQNPQKCLDDKAKKLEKSTAPSPSNLERELVIAISNASDTATQGNLYAQSATAVAAEAAKTNKEMLMAAVSTDAMAQTSTIQALDKEMKQMNLFFDTFRKLFMTLSEDVPGLASTKACEKLKSKEACT